MASTKSAGYHSPKMMPGDGRAVVLNDQATQAANPTANDTVDFLLPAGFELSALRFNVPDMDAGAGLAGKIGYAPVDAASSLTADDDYFMAAGALGQAAALIDCRFAPITFQEDVKVQITWTVAAAGAFTAAPIHMTAIGNSKGPR